MSLVIFIVARHYTRRALTPGFPCPVLPLARVSMQRYGHAVIAVRASRRTRSRSCDRMSRFGRGLTRNRLDPAWFLEL